jgi:hypothetical protein
MKICPSPVFFEPVAILAKICPSFFQKVLNFGYHIFRNWCPYIDTCTFHILDTIFSETGALTSIIARFIFWIPYFQKLVPLRRYLHVSYFGYHIFRNWWCPYVDTCTFHILDTMKLVPLCRYLHVSYFGYHIFWNLVFHHFSQWDLDHDFATWRTS